MHEILRYKQLTHWETTIHGPQ